MADGLQGAHVNGVAQDRDGSLWIATLTGLLHFDGFEFEVYDEASGDLPTSRITIVEIGPSGRLWVGTEQGHVLLYQDGSFRELGRVPYPGARVATMSEDRDGTLWVARYGDPARSDQSLLWQFRSGDPLEGGLVAREDLDSWWIGQDSAGTWGTIAHDGTVEPAPLPSRAIALSRDRDGEVWGYLPLGRMIRLRDGLTDPFGQASVSVTESESTLGSRVVQDGVELFDPVSHASLGLIPSRAGVWLRDRRGLIWVGEHHGSTLRALRGDGGEPVTTIDLGSMIRDVAEDREGNLWVSTMTKGLVRISEAPIRPLGPEDGVPLPSAVGLTPTGELFVVPAPTGPCFPLNVVHEAGTEIQEGMCGWALWTRSGVLWHLDADGVVVRPPGREQRLALEATWMVEDPARDGVVWLIGHRELYRAETQDTGEVAVTRTFPVVANRAIVADGSGGIWIGGRSGLWHLAGETLGHFDRDDGLPVDNVRAILPDGRGGLWLGTYGGGLVHFDGQRFATVEPFNGRVLRATVANLIRSRQRLRDRYAAEGAAEGAAAEIEGLRHAVADPADQAYLERLEHALAGSIHDENFTVDDLGRLVFQSRVSLYRHVKRLFGMSPSDLIRERRLVRARHLLEQREGSVSEVAYAVGFKSASHFSNSYVARFGVRPSADVGVPSSRS